MLCVARELALDGRSVGVIGGSRWGRVILGCLDRVLPADVGVWVVTPRNAGATSRWLTARDWARRWGVAESLPLATAMGAGPTLVVVANEARDHVRSAEEALAVGHRVMCEKPIALRVDEAEHLVALSCSLERPLLASNVYLFASYLTGFAHQVVLLGPPHRIQVDWADPESEVRYGEKKSFDLSLDVIADVLPHVVSILYLLGVKNLVARRVVSVGGGGARVVLEMAGDQVVVRIRLERNARRRRRTINADTDSGSISLDFTAEPGLITDRGGSVVAACSNWDRLPSPMSQMLETAWRQHAERSFDQRLSFRHALRACHLHSQLLDRYEVLRARSLRHLTSDSLDSVGTGFGRGEIEWISDPTSGVGEGK